MKVIHVYLSVSNDMAYSIIVSVTWFCSNIWLSTILCSLTISYTVVSSTEAKLTSECISVTTRYFVSVFFYSAPCTDMPYWITVRQTKIWVASVGHQNRKSRPRFSFGLCVCVKMQPYALDMCKANHTIQSVSFYTIACSHSST